MNYLFGRAVRPVRPSATGHREVFVLGAYPSALHVGWRSPDATVRMRAVAVDDEPEPFWTGRDEAERIAQWSRDVGFREEWGTVTPCGRLNGPSGAWVEDRVLRPLGVERSSAWITDCLDTYCESGDAAARLDDPAVVRLLERLRIVPRRHHPHPSEGDIVRGAIAQHRTRLLGELREAAPARVVTLGNAALRVVAALVDGAAPALRKLSSAAGAYGRAVGVRIDGRPVEWLPLAHPAAPAAYQRAHEGWVTARSVREVA